MPVIEIRISVPEGTAVNIVAVEDGEPTQRDAPGYADPVGRYWRDYLSANARRLFGAAARVETVAGPGYSLEELAQNLSVSYDTVQSWLRNSGRTAKRWRSETGTPEPIRLEDLAYQWSQEFEGMRTTYRLPDGVGETILRLQSED